MNLTRRNLLSSSLLATIPMPFAAAPASAASRTKGVSATEVVLGTHLDLSGPATIVMPAIRNGLQMRVDEANEEGGVAGRKLRLIVEDNAGQPSQAIRAVSKLIESDEVFALLCPWGTGTNVATVGRVLDAGVLCFGPYAASDELRKAVADHSLLFTVNPDYDTTTASGVRWAAKTFNATKFGLIREDNSFGESVARGVRQACSSLGLAAPAEVAYKVGDIDFSARVARLKALGSDFIVLGGSARETIAACTEVQRSGWKGVRVMTASPVRNTQVTRLGKGAVEGLYGVGTWLIEPPEQQSVAVRAWNASYRRQFSVDADDVAMVFYGYADWFVQALRTAGKDLSVASLAAALRQSTYKGIASYAAQRFVDNHIAPEWVRIEQVEQSVWTPRSNIIDASTKL